MLSPGAAAPSQVQSDASVRGFDTARMSGMGLSMTMITEAEVILFHAAGVMPAAHSRRRISRRRRNAVVRDRPA